jgi:hemerythrin-like domain-containing protein
MNQPTDRLVREHEKILQMLDVLDRLGQLATSGEAPLDQIEGAIEFVRVYADDCHHGKEEALLFPAMEKAGMPPEGGPVAVMLHEHVQGRGHVADMAAALDGLKAGDAGAGDAFANAAAAYTSLLRDHIDKEDHCLFPMAEQLLGQEAKVELEAEFERVDGEDVGPETIGRMEAFLEQARGLLSEATS